MIKVGQIYSNQKSRLFVITGVSIKWITVQFNDAIKIYRYARKNFEKYNLTLISEYPTWQEAVNSKEFKG